MNKLKIYLLIAASLCIQTELLSMNLGDLCNKVIRDNPRYYIEHDIEQRITDDAIDSLRQSWAFQHSMQNHSWYMELLKSAMTRVSIPARGDTVEFNNVHTLIKTYDLGSSADPDVSDIEVMYYDFDGKRVSVKRSLCGDLVHPDFIPDQVDTHMNERELDAWGLGKRRYGFRWLGNTIHSAKRSKARKKIVTIEGVRSYIYDTEPCYNLNEYLSERAPLAQLFVVQMLEKAHQDNEEVVFTPKEYKILQAFPPRYKNAIEFMSKNTTYFECDENYI